MNNNENDDLYWFVRDNDVINLSADILADRSYFEAAFNKCNNYDDFWHLLNNSPIDFLQDKIVDIITYNPISIHDIPEQLLNNYGVALHFASKDIDNLHILPMSFRDNEEFINQLTYKNGMVLSFASNRIRHNSEICENAVSTNGDAIEFVPEHLRSKNICFNSIKKYNPKNWIYIPHDLANNIDFIMEAGNVSGQIYQFFTNELKNDENITKHFLKKSGINLSRAPEKFKNDPDCVNIACESENSNLMFASHELKNNARFIAQLVNKNPRCIFHSGETIKNNCDIAINVCMHKLIPAPIKFFNDEVKNNPSVALVSLLNSPQSMEYMDLIKNDKEFILNYIEQEKFDPHSMKYISNNLKNDFEVMEAAFKRSNKSLNYVGDDLRFNKDFLDTIFNGNITSNLENLKQINLKSGDEALLLYFFDKNKEYYNENKYGKYQKTIKYSNDIHFRNDLSQHIQLYEYLSALVLHTKLNQDIEQKYDKNKKIKI